MAPAMKLFEMGRLTSGQAAQLAAEECPRSDRPGVYLSSAWKPACSK